MRELAYLLEPLLVLVAVGARKYIADAIDAALLSRAIEDPPRYVKASL